MAYLDDELAGEERRELETHMIDCTTCRTHVDGERSELSLVRTRLATPPAPDLLKARVARALDAEDAQHAKRERRRWSGYLLPASATAAAVAALVAFVAVKPVDSNGIAPDLVEVTRQHKPMPLEVQGASTTPWLQQNFTPSVEVPQFASPGIRLVGARLTAVNGHDAALLAYNVATGQSEIGLSAIVIRNLDADDLSGGTEIQVGNRTLHVLESDTMVAVTYVSASHMGYAFMTDRLSPDDLVRLVVSSDLIGRAQRGR
jgi:anti-sigma factor RsiW